jgi:hypothetical protein
VSFIANATWKFVIDALNENDNVFTSPVPVTMYCPESNTFRFPVPEVLLMKKPFEVALDVNDVVNVGAPEFGTRFNLGIVSAKVKTCASKVYRAVCALRKNGVDFQSADLRLIVNRLHVPVRWR